MTLLRASTLLLFFAIVPNLSCARSIGTSSNVEEINSIIPSRTLAVEASKLQRRNPNRPPPPRVPKVAQMAEMAVHYLDSTAPTPDGGPRTMRNLDVQRMAQNHPLPGKIQAGPAGSTDPNKASIKAANRYAKLAKKADKRGDKALRFYYEGKSYKHRANYQEKKAEEQAPATPLRDEHMSHAIMSSASSDAAHGLSTHLYAYKSAKNGDNDGANAKVAKAEKLYRSANEKIKKAEDRYEEGEKKRNYGTDGSNTSPSQYGGSTFGSFS